MKRILYLVLVSFYSFTCNAQDPELFRTWYLYHVHMDFDEAYFVSNINPPIHPYLIIEEDFSFFGEGACNTFNGVYNISPDEMFTTSFNNTNDDCGIQIHNFFENDYFGFISGGFLYTINQESDGLTLYVDTPLMSGLTFKEFPLSISESIIFETKIYPNPTSEKLFISSESIKVESYSIYSVLGIKVLEKSNLLNNLIDVSTLSEGVYFIEIISEKGRIVKKFIKK